MKIFINGEWCDTKFDWGYKSDKDYVLHLLEENEQIRPLKSAVAALISHLEGRFDEYEDGKWLDKYRELIKG